MPPSKCPPLSRVLRPFLKALFFGTLGLLIIPLYTVLGFVFQVIFYGSYHGTSPFGKLFFLRFPGTLSKSYEDMAGYFWGANQRFPADVCETTQVEIDGEVRSMAAEYVLEAQVQGVGVVRGQLSGDNLWDNPQEPLENTTNTKNTPVI